MKTRIFTTMLALFAIATAAQAQFGGGTGEHYDPYIISTTDHLTELANNVNNGITSYEDTFFRLDADLDFTGKTYTPIGRSSRPFRGDFDGNYKSINNVTLVTDNNYIGLFGNLAYPANVYHLFLDGHSRIEGRGFIGGIAGNIDGGFIRGCEVGADVVVAARGNALGFIGGIVGFADGGTCFINYCVSRATVTENGTNSVGIGGIVGYTEYNPRVTGCVSLSTIVGTNGVGGIIGKVDVGTPEVTNCLYTNFTGGGIEGADSDGASYMGRISFGDGFSEAAVVSGASFQDGDTPYYKSGTTVELRLTGASPGWAYHFFGNGAPLSPDGNDRYSVTMPTHSDLLVTATKGKRDIAYEPWVSVSIPSQEYTGSPLTPAVTVTDSKDGAPVTLTEGVHYTVTLPDGLTDYGHYDITISGIGTFEGQTTARFTITAPQGTEDNPFVISTTDEMDAFAAAVNNGLMPEGQYIVLDADLDYTGKTYTPVGAPTNPFKGNFNGNGHAISNVVINKTNDDYLGLFGIVDGGTVADLVLGTGSSITGSSFVGGIVGFNIGGTVAGCFVSENVVILGEGEIGGIVGSNVGGTVAGCLVSENVTVTASQTNVGGIVGAVNGGTIDYCVNNSSVAGDNYVGGITGFVYTTATLSNNLNLGAVSCYDGVFGAGGIVSWGVGITLVNNLWAGNCTVGGVDNADEDGARRGWVVSAADGIFVQLMPDEDYNFTGITHEGIAYLGAGQTGYFTIQLALPEFMPEGYTVSAGTLTPVSSEYFDDYYALTMPSEGQNVTISLVGEITLELLDNDLEAYPSNDSRISTADGKTVNVKLQGRTFYKTGIWNTICLPFNLDDFTGTPLEGATVKTLASSSYANGTLTLNFTTATTIEAGKPYLVKWASGDNIENPVFSGVTICNTLAPTVTDCIDFLGSYDIEYLTAYDRTVLYLGGDSKLYYPTDNMPVNAFRGYFQLKNGLTAGDLPNSAKNFVLNFGDETTTIGASLNDNGQMINDNYYSIDGRRLQGKPTKKGIYIRNGKKIVK